MRRTRPRRFGTLALLLVAVVALGGCASGDDTTEADGPEAGSEEGSSAEGDADAATGDDPAEPGDESADAAGAGFVLDGTTYPVTSMSCEFDLYVEGDISAVADLDEGGTVTVTTSPETGPEFQVFEATVDNEMWSVRVADAADSLQVERTSGGISASGKMASPNVDGVVDASLDAPCS